MDQKPKSKNSRASKAIIKSSAARKNTKSVPPSSTRTQKPQTKAAPLGWIPSARLGKNRRNKRKRKFPVRKKKPPVWSRLKFKDNIGVELFSGAHVSDNDFIVDEVLNLKISNPDGEIPKEKKNSNSASHYATSDKENIKNKLWGDGSDLKDDPDGIKVAGEFKKQSSMSQVRSFGVQITFTNEVERLKYLNFIKGELPKKPLRGPDSQSEVKNFLKEKKQPAVVVEDKKRQRIAKRVAKQAEKEKSPASQDGEITSKENDSGWIDEILADSNYDTETEPILNAPAIKKTPKRKKTKKLHQKKNLRHNTRLLV